MCNVCEDAITAYTCAHRLQTFNCHLKQIVNFINFNLLDYSEVQTLTVFLPGFSTLGSSGPIEKPKGGHEGQMQVTI